VTLYLYSATTRSNSLQLARYCYNYASIARTCSNQLESLQLVLHIFTNVFSTLFTRLQLRRVALVVVMAESDSDTTFKSYKTVVLKGSDNYAEWELSIATTLMGKDLFDVISIARASKPPATTTITAEYTKSTREHAKAFAIIIQSLSNVIQSSLSPAARNIKLPDAHLLWEELKRKYSASVGSRQAALLHDIWTTRIGEQDDPAPTLSKIQSAHAQLNNGGENLSDRMLAFAMTMALPESYSTLQQTMWMQEHLDSSTVAGAVQAEWAR